MAVSNIESQLLAILNVLKQSEDGLKIGEITGAVSPQIPRRTLYRRLAVLVERGEVTASGEKAQRLYYATEHQEIGALTNIQRLKHYVNQPLTQREPVGYNTEFLYGYKPNQSYYLSASIRQHLLELGSQYHDDIEPGTYVKQILQRFLIDLSWNSSRLEGNTYSLLETERLIQFGSESQGKTALEAQMILNHKAAIEFMVESVDVLGFNKHSIYTIHALLANNLLANPDARGRLRKIPVGIGRTVYQPPEVPQLVEECFGRLLTTANQIKDPFEQAFFALLHIPYLQAFEDINKRTSRLACNIPLIRHNLIPLSFADLPKEDYVEAILAIYELNEVGLMKDIFISMYERSSKQYRLLRHNTQEPDLVKLRYRDALSVIIKKIIHDNIQGKCIPEVVEQWAKDNIDEASGDAFVHAVLNEIAGLHEGNIIVYKIDPERFAQWK